jgi:formylglycine-generating enzyme required for sulfatase activity
MRLLAWAIGLVAALLLAPPALAQGGLVFLPSDQFGKVVVRLPQSAGGLSLVQLQNVLGRNANFEPLSNYREQDRFRRIALPVGRLDVLMASPVVPGNGYSNCTASILSARHIITNAHCFPQEQGGVRQAFLLMDYYSDDNEGAVRRFEVRATPVERNVELDFAIAEVSGNPSAQFGRIALEPRDPEPGESLLIVHHPMGKPKHMTRGGCRAHAPVAISGTDIRHRCDTLPGSSGSPILAEGTGRMLGLHYGGALDAQVPGSFNSGKRLSEISSRSRILAAALAEQRQQEEQATRAASSAAAAERAEFERRIRDAEAAARAEVDRLKAQLEAAERRVAAVPPPAPAPAPRAETPADWAAAEAALGLAPDRIREVQQSLRAAGHDPRGIDGNLGQGTRGAIRAWQRARGVAETGYLSAEMLRLLQEGNAPAVAAVRPPAPATPPSPAQPAVGIWPAPPREAPRSFRDCPECPEMVVVPAGSTRLASGRDVTIAAPFAVGKFEVTFEDWDACVAQGGCSHRPDDRGWGRGRQPVINVSWDDAQAYVAWLSRKTGKPYRLLSEAEWEYAAQAGSGREAAATRGANIANCVGCGSRWDGRQAAPAGSFAANAFGLHDMLGNVWEWTADCWNASHDGALADGSVRLTGDCSRRVLRGGSWYGYPVDTRSAYRYWSPSDIRYDLIGFRVARTL